MYRGALFTGNPDVTVLNTTGMPTTWQSLAFPTVYRDTESALPMADRLYVQSPDKKLIIAQQRFDAKLLCNGVFAPVGNNAGKGVVQLCFTLGGNQGSGPWQRPVNQNVIMAGTTTTDIATESYVLEFFPGSSFGVAACYYGPAGAPAIPLIGSGFGIEIQ